MPWILQVYTTWPKNSVYHIVDDEQSHINSQQVFPQNQQTNIKKTFKSILSVWIDGRFVPFLLWITLT